MNPERDKACEPVAKQSRSITRNCGLIEGRMDELLPCIYFSSENNRLWQQEKKGLQPGFFSLAPHLYPEVGMILPLRLCRDAGMRATLEEVAAIIENRHSSMAERRRAVQNKLVATFGEDLCAAPWESMDGFFEIMPSAGFFQLLRENFDYVAQVLDVPDSSACISATEAFIWGSHDWELIWEMLETPTSKRSDGLHFTPFFISRDTCALSRWILEERDFFDNIRRFMACEFGNSPPSVYESPPPKLNAKIEFEFRMVRRGEAAGRLSIKETTHDISREIFFIDFDYDVEKFLAWGREIEEGDLPMGISFYEDAGGEVWVDIYALPVVSEGHALICIHRNYYGPNGGASLLLRATLPRAALVAALKKGVRSFFENDFTAEKWSPFDDEWHLKEAALLKERVLNHPWLKTDDREK